MKPRLSFLLAVACASLNDRLQGRALALNDDAVFAPNEAAHGTESLDADANALVSFRNAVVVIGSDDRHFTLPAAATDIPRGILVNDTVDAGEPGNIRKNVALFGVHPGTLPAVAAAPIAVNAQLVADLATPGCVKTLPTTPGSYVVFGRSRFTVTTAGDPVSIIHGVPHVVTVS